MGLTFLPEIVTDAEPRCCMHDDEHGTFLCSILYAMTEPIG